MALQLSPPRVSPGDPWPFVRIDLALSPAGRREALKHSYRLGNSAALYVTPEDSEWERAVALVSDVPADDAEIVLVINAPWRVDRAWFAPEDVWLAPSGGEPWLNEPVEQWRRPRPEVVRFLEPQPIDTFGNELSVFLQIEEDQRRLAAAAAEEIAAETQVLYADWRQWVDVYLDVVRKDVERLKNDPDVVSTLYGADSGRAVYALANLLHESDGLWGRDVDVDVIRREDELFDAHVRALRAGEQAEDRRRADADRKHELAEAEKWVKAHGSSRLRKALTLEMLPNSLAAYRDERLKVEHPSWEWISVEWLKKFRDPVNPSETHLDALIEARSWDKRARLKYLPSVGEPGGRMWVVATFLGRYIGIDAQRLVELGYDEEPF